MGRWEPDARARLEQAGLELYHERGYQQTTVADIAERAGLTERTFFRHFTDKREVLFGRTTFVDVVVAAVTDAPSDASPIAAVRCGLEAAGELLRDRHATARLRREIIWANVELKERESMKLAGLATSIGEVLRQRGVDEAGAKLVAEIGIAAFRVAFDRWIALDPPPSFPDLYDAVFGEFAVVVAPLRAE